MTKDMLGQYQDKCAEIKVLSRNGLYPKRREDLERQKAEIEAFVDGIEDSRLRSIVILRVLEGLTWQQVAGRMGYGISTNNARKIYWEGLKNILNS